MSKTIDIAFDLSVISDEDLEIWIAHQQDEREKAYKYFQQVHELVIEAEMELSKRNSF